MTNCTNQLKSKKVQLIFKKEWKKKFNQLMKENGGLPEFYARDWREGFKKGFMDSCKIRRKTSHKTNHKLSHKTSRKTKKNNSYNK